MIQQEITKRILILDGAMGSVIQEYGLDEKDFRGDRFQDLPGLIKGNNDILNLTRPDVIGDIYERYLKAGADIISTIVAGSVGPMNKTCSMSPDVSNPAYRELTYDQALEAYMEQIGGLVDGGADVILIETVFDTLNAKAAIDAAVRVIDGRDIPIMVSVTISDAAGRTLSGQTLDAFLASVSSYPIFSIGLNCSFGARQMKPYLKELSRRAPYYISCHPNAGLPNSLGLYDETPETMAPQIAEFIDEKLVNIVGGCCGTTPAFIEKYAPLVVGKEP